MSRTSPPGPNLLPFDPQQAVASLRHCAEACRCESRQRTHRRLTPAAFRSLSRLTPASLALSPARCCQRSTGRSPLLRQRKTLAGRAKSSMKCGQRIHALILQEVSGSHTIVCLRGRYRLLSVLVHEGSHLSGHYFRFGSNAVQMSLTHVLAHVLSLQLHVQLCPERQMVRVCTRVF